MQIVWCWRCRADIPMLDDEEFAEIRRLYSAAMRTLKLPVNGDSPPTSQDAIHERMVPVRDAYFRITGYRETNTVAILHHAVALYGPPRASCGRPLRTPRARHCAACGHWS